MKHQLRKGVIKMAQCKYCNDQTTNNNGFCNSSHMTLYYRDQKRVLKICQNCGRTYRGTPEQKFCSNYCNLAYHNKLRTGENHHNYKGGRYMASDGYIKIKMPEHPRASKDGYVPEHIVIKEKDIGRPINRGEEVHHVNSQRNDNRPENLFVFSSGELHRLFHKAIQKQPELTPEEFIKTKEPKHPDL